MILRLKNSNLRILRMNVLEDSKEWTIPIMMYGVLEKIRKVHIC